VRRGGVSPGGRGGVALVKFYSNVQCKKGLGWVVIFRAIRADMVRKRHTRPIFSAKVKDKGDG